MKAGAIFASFRISRNTFDNTITEELNEIAPKYIKAVLIIFYGILVLWTAFVVLSFLIFLMISFPDIVENLNVSPLVLFLISAVLGWFLFLIMAFKVG